MFNRAVFLFRRDLRLPDNTGLIEACRQARHVLPVFVFDDEILARFGSHSFRMSFLLDSLSDLDASIAEAGGSLRFFRGNPASVLTTLLMDNDIDAVYLNGDYTPFSQKRDAALGLVEERCGKSFVVVPDQMLNEPGTVTKRDGRPYQVFTPYFREAGQRSVAEPQCPEQWNFERLEIGRDWHHINKPVSEAVTGGGRAHGLAVLGRTCKLKDYDQTRDYPALNGTSGLSAHLRFGTVSAREAWHAIAGSLGSGHPLIRQLHWRDFFMQVATHFPHVFGHAFKRMYDAIEWRQNDDLFDLWCEGRTGFPIVDAGMRELAATGYMHNRVRMVTASFLVKNLHVDWRRGEAHFRRYLIDYDPCVNNGNWQWAASTGCDAQPWFRVFNPFRQQHKFDAQAEYIKRWVPELQDWSPKRIHGLERDGTGYLPQIVDLKSSAEDIKQLFRAVGQERLHPDA